MEKLTENIFILFFIFFPNTIGFKDEMQQIKLISMRLFLAIIFSNPPLALIKNRNGKGLIPEEAQVRG